MKAFIKEHSDTFSMSFPAGSVDIVLALQIIGPMFESKGPNPVFKMEDG